MNRPMRTDLDPDLAVALGAGVMAARCAGHEVDQVLVDINSYSFGMRCLGYIGEEWSNGMFSTIIAKGCAVPITRFEKYQTTFPFQDRVDFEIYQGEHPFASRNLKIGEFSIGELTEQEEPIEFDCRMRLDLDGILVVEAIEAETGHTATITITGAARKMSAAEVEMCRSRQIELMKTRAAPYEAALRPEVDPDVIGPTVAIRSATAMSSSPSTAAPIVEDRCSRLSARLAEAQTAMNLQDWNDAKQLLDQMTAARLASDPESVDRLATQLEELLFYVWE